MTRSTRRGSRVVAGAALVAAAMGSARADAPAELTASQHAIVPIAALAAAGGIERLKPAIEQGLDAGLAVGDAKEVLVQVYAYAGFPRSPNALTALMQVAEDRRQRGIVDAPGRAPSRPVPTGDALLVAGTANQTKLSGAPVAGPLFDFAPLANQVLRTHLFGDLFERDNLDWTTREVATIAMLAALVGVEAQLQAHVRIGMNVGLTEAHLRELAGVLDARVDADSAGRMRQAIDRHLATTKTTR